MNLTGIPTKKEVLSAIENKTKICFTTEVGTFIYAEKIQINHEKSGYMEINCEIDGKDEYIAINFLTNSAEIYVTAAM